MDKIKMYSERIKNQKLTALQGLDLPEPAAGQIHRPMGADDPDLFYLVIGLSDDGCQIIPGSFDSMMACTDDIILPQTVFGDFVFLSLNLADTVPAATLGKGFAQLDDETFSRVLASLTEFQTGTQGKIRSYPFSALPFTGEADPRIWYHSMMSEVISKAKENIDGEQDNIIYPATFSQPLQPLALSPVFQQEELVLAAGEEKEDPYTECSVDGCNDTATVEYELEEKRLRIKCFTPEEDVSYFFDGWNVFDGSGKCLGIIFDGKLLVKNMTSFDGKLSFQDEFGYFYPLCPKE